MPSTQPIVRASDDVCQQQLLKVLDTLDKAEKALTASTNEIEARKRLDALKNELLAVKDQMIADLVADNNFLRKNRNSTKSRIRKILETIEKIALIGAGVYIGRN